eukprot:COSAG03_NODE_72_length_14536_cov_62.546336_15_plen_121_part_00
MPPCQAAITGPDPALIDLGCVADRGSPLMEGADRVVCNITFKRADHEWITNWNDGWGKTMYDDGMPLRRLIATASLDQRAVLGFPAPGHRYWTPGTIEAVRARYGPLGMDLAPYVEAARM